VCVAVVSGEQTDKKKKKQLTATYMQPQTKGSSVGQWCETMVPGENRPWTVELHWNSYRQRIFAIVNWTASVDGKYTLESMEHDRLLSLGALDQLVRREKATFYDE
jgi:hypothetical protein